MKAFKRTLIWFAILAVVLTVLSGFTPAVSSTAQQSKNLLTNPGFEGDYIAQSSNISVAPGWSAWWVPHQSGQPGWQTQQPNFEPTSLPDRVHTGAKAQLVASFYSNHIAGVYQQVSVAAGADLRFAAQGKGWTSTYDDPLNTSVDGTDLQMRIGIDPFGGTDAGSPNVVWSKPFNAADSWFRFEMYARAQATTVTVFLYSAPFEGRRHNAVFWDDAELVSLTGDAAATAQAYYPTATPTPIIFTPTPVTVAEGSNLLANPSFEGSSYIPCTWKADPIPWNHIPCDPWYGEIMRRWNTVYTPQDWTAWWREPITDTTRPDFYTYPNQCPKGAPETCVVWHNPEYGSTAKIINGPPRIHSGKNSLKYFTFWSVHEGGVFQTVSGITSGTLLRFSAYMHAWSATAGPNNEEPSPFVSAGQTSMHMKIGIDPTGGRNPWSGDIVWGPEFDSYDQFGYYQVTAAAQSDKVTVFTYTRPEKAMKHNDVYVDDAELVAVSIPGGSTAAPAQPPAAPAQAAPVVPAAPRATSTPRPDGSRVHVVKPGDTLFGLSLEYQVSMDQIMRLNNIRQDTLLQIGQELVIALPDALAQSTRAPADASSATAIPSPDTPEANAQKSGKLCVRAFTDANDDGIRSSAEELVGGVAFILNDAQRNIVATYTSDGVSEPHCFEEPAGTYSLQVQVPAGRVATSGTQWGVAIGPGAQIDIDFGSRAAVPGASSVTSRAPEPADGSGKALSGLLGIILVAMAGGLAWFLRTRSRSL